MGLKEIVMFFPLLINILLPGDTVVFQENSFTILLHLFLFFLTFLHYLDPPMQ